MSDTRHATGSSEVNAEVNAPPPRVAHHRRPRAGADTTATANRIEEQIGRDLQFIRINGTLVGGLIGLLIHTVRQLLAPFF